MDETQETKTFASPTQSKVVPPRMRYYVVERRDEHGIWYPIHIYEDIAEAYVAAAAYGEDEDGFPKGHVTTCDFVPKGSKC